MSILDDGAWRALPDADKRHLRDRLAEECARRGIPINDTTSPGILALRHEPAVTVQRPHLELIDRELTKLLATPNAKLMIWTPPQVGKALALDTPIFTTRGWSTIGRLKIGDTVYDRHGEPCKVTWKSPVWNDRDCFNVRTNDGESIVASAEHEWVARLDKRWGEKVHETRVLAQSRRKRAQVTNPAGLNIPEREDLPLHPYVLGYWLGDGSSGQAAITTADIEVVEHIRDLGYTCRPFNNRKYAWTLVPEGWVARSNNPSRVKRALNDLGLGAGNAKFLPDMYLRASAKQRLELLQGLVDSDGYVHPTTGVVEFCSTNADLAEGVRDLVFSLGSKASIRTGRATINGRDCGMKYRVSFMLRDAAWLPRKAERCRDSSAGRTRYVWAEQVDTVPTQCIEVDSPDHTYLAGRTLLPTHNSMRVSRWFPFWWLTHRPRDRVILASYAASLANTHGAACRDLVESHGLTYGLRMRDDENTRANWSLTTGGGMRSVGTKGGLTGHPMNLGIIDDPFADRAAADSPLIRERVWEWYSSAYTTRKAPGAREVIVMTRWHPLDLCGRLLERDGRTEEGGEWTVLHLPALAVAPDPAKGIYADPLGREPGDPLTHPVIDLGDIDSLADHWRRKKKGSTSRDWNAVYQGSPFDSEGALLTEAHIRDATADLTLVTPRIAGVGIDPSGGGRDTAGIVGGILGADGKFYWTHNRTARMTSDRWSREACLLADEMDADRFVIEVNYGGDQATTLLKQAWDALQREGAIDKRKLCPRLVPVHSRKSKLLRAEPIAQAILTQRAWFGRDPGLSDFKSEWQLWEPGSTWSPGALDAGVHLATDMLPPINSGSSVSSAAKRSRSSVTGTSSLAARRTR